MLHVVCNIENVAWQRWQARLLEFSHARAAQRGPITTLVSGTWNRTPATRRTFFTDASSPRAGDDYSPYNKPGSLAAWLREAPPAEESILILDPDCVFLRAADLRAVRGRPVAQPVFYMDFRDERPLESLPPALRPFRPRDMAVFRRLVEKLSPRPELVAGVGIPTLIHRDDLAALAPLWLRRTEEIRADPELRGPVGWIAEMYGYCLAAADLGLRHELRDLAHFSIEDRDDLPLVHYCYEVKPHERADGWGWNKRTYRPWAPVPPTPPDIPRAMKRVVALVREYAAIQEHRPFGEHDPLLARTAPPAPKGNPVWGGDPRAVPVKAEKRPFPRQEGG